MRDTTINLFAPADRGEYTLPADLLRCATGSNASATHHCPRS